MYLKTTTMLAFSIGVMSLAHAETEEDRNAIQRFKNFEAAVHTYQFDSAEQIVDSFTKTPSEAQKKYSGQWFNIYGTVQTTPANDGKNYNFIMTGEKNKNIQITASLYPYQYHSRNDIDQPVTTHIEDDISTIASSEPIIINCLIDGKDQKNVNFTSCLYWNHPTYKKMFIKKMREPVTPFQS